MKISYSKFKELMISKYKAEIITKKQFKEAIYGPNRDDIDDDVYTLTENIIDSENVVFYLINKVEIINKYCKCVNTQMFPGGQIMPLPTSRFMPYITLVAELDTNRENVIDYAKWGSYADNLFSEIDSLEKEKTL